MDQGIDFKTQHETKTLHSKIKIYLIVKPIIGPIINLSESAISERANTILYFSNPNRSTKSANNAVLIDLLKAKDKTKIPILIFKNRILLEKEVKEKKYDDKVDNTKAKDNNLNLDIWSLKYPAIGVPIRYVKVAIVIMKEQFNVVISKL